MIRRLLFVLASAGPALAAWIRLDSAHFELYTDAGASRGRQILERLELVRHAFAAAPGAPALPRLPVRVLLFDSAAGFRPLRPSESTVGFFQAGPERSWIVLHWAGAETGRVAAHEYVHLVLNHTTLALPRWLEEGMAEFYSTLRADAEGLVVGTPIPTHVATLRRGARLDASTLATVTRDSPFYNQPDKAGVFYAQSWALVHMLNLGEPYRGALARFVEVLDQGADVALELAFGKSLEALLHDLERYVAQGRFPVVRVGWHPGEVREIGAARPVGEEEALLVQAELLLDMGRDEEATRLYRRLAARWPDSPAVDTGLGALALRRRDHAEARQRLARAIERGVFDARAHFEYAMLLRESGGSPEAVRAALETAVRLNPQFAEAHFMLGGTLLRAGRRSEAIGHLEQAAALLPRQSFIWHALALALHEAGRTDEARRAAWRAVQTATTDAEAEMARAAVQKTGEARPTPRAARRGITIPPSWEPEKGKVVAGELVQVDCLERAARVYLRVERRTLALFIRDPSRVRIRSAGAEPVELRCGPHASTRATVEYIERADARYHTDGDVIAMELQ
ncbi:MAG: tetratricopeptide repeat protein [Bryobacteraceae bacterium]|nr:tetratricopeptide repeat protein [Bryobacteraceae bacterium]